MLNVNEMLKQFDLFAAQPTLRAQSQPGIANACGGILSIFLLGCFAYLFITQFIQVLHWETVSSVYTEGNILNR